MSHNYPGKIVITGASGGIGSRLVSEFLKSGTRDLICQYRSHFEPLRSVFKEYGLDSDQYCFQADLTKEEEVQGLRSFATRGSANIWGLINLAGASGNGMSWKLSTSDFKEIVDANLLTTFLACREFIPLMRSANRGRILNISSVVAFDGVVGASHYCSAKAGIVGLTKALAHELANKNITVNALALGYFEYGLINEVPEELLAQIKERIPLKSFGKIESISGMVNYLLDESSSYTTGQVVHINGGLY